MNVLKNFLLPNISYCRLIPYCLHVINFYSQDFSNLSQVNKFIKYQSVKDDQLYFISYPMYFLF